MYNEMLSTVGLFQTVLGVVHYCFGEGKAKCGQSEHWQGGDHRRPFLQTSFMHDPLLQLFWATLGSSPNSC